MRDRINNAERIRGRRKSARLSPLAPACAFLVAIAACGPKRGSPLPLNAKWGYCPVCSMKVNSSDEWVSEIIYSDGTKLMFESPADMLAFYFEPQRYRAAEPQKNRSNITQLLVRDYRTRDRIDAGEATLVYKSKIAGPMGPDFFAFTQESEAAAFVASNGGKEVSLDGVTLEMLQNLRK